MEPILLDVPIEMETERLHMRCPRPGDGAGMNAAIVESAGELSEWMPWAVPTPEPSTTEKWCREAAAKFMAREQFHFAFFRKATGEYLGNCGLHRIVWDVPLVEMGYWLRTSACGNGYMTEAVSEMLRFAFDRLGVNRVEIRVDERNARSARVAERVGCLLDGVLRCDARGVAKELRDTRIYSRIRADFGEKPR